MAIKIGQRAVLESGSVLTENKNPVTIQIRDLSVKINFIDEAKNTIDARVSQTGEKGLTVNLVNFNNSGGSSFDDIVGEIDGKPLVLGLYVHSLGAERRVHLLHYTFSVGEGFSP
jgi:hypothetical protein